MTITHEFLSSTDLVTKSDATYKQVDYWCRTGLLPDTARGSGTNRVFLHQEIPVVRASRHLSAMGCRMQGLKAAADVIRWNYQNHTLHYFRYLVVHGPTDAEPFRVVLTPSMTEIISPSWVLPLESIGDVG